MKLFSNKSLFMIGMLPLLAGMTCVLGAAEQPATPPVASGPFTLPALPYAQDALKAYISEQTMSFHYGKHHRAYVTTLNQLVAGTPLASGQTLEQVILACVAKEDKTAIFNNAAQVWNHSFYWKSMKPGGGGEPSDRMLGLLNKSFGSVDQFKKDFVAAALKQFGSGWVWLVQDGDTLKIVTTSNADTPIAHGQTALLTCDVWEHAYYLDYQNLRKDYVQAYLDHLVNWEFASSQLK